MAATVVIVHFSLLNELGYIHTCTCIHRKRVYTYPVGDLATSLGVRWQPDPGGFSFCLGVPIQVAGQRIQNKIRHPIL